MPLRNLIAGVSVDHADDTRLEPGVTAILFDTAAAVAIEVRVGAP